MAKTKVKGAKTPHFEPGYFDQVWVDEELPMDAELTRMSRLEVLPLDKLRRARWFYLAQVSHSELQRISELVYQLLDPHNSTRIIVIVGMTNVGKSALAKNLIPALIERLYGPVPDCYLPHIYSKAPANGDNKIPWSTIYAGWLKACQEPFIERKRDYEVSDGSIRALRGHSPSLAAYRGSLRDVLQFRRVKAICLDEVLHLLRFEDYAACMDTFKDLCEDREAKLILFGPFETARIICQYGQSMSRTAMLHFRRYVTADQATTFNDCVEGSKHNQKGFKYVASKLEQLWPAQNVPPLAALCEKYLMPNCMGAVGLLKRFALRLLSAQMFQEDELITPEMIRDAAYTQKFGEQVSSEIAFGEELIYGACYGQNSLGNKSALQDIAQIMATRT